MAGGFCALAALFAEKFKKSHKTVIETQLLDATRINQIRVQLEAMAVELDIRRLIAVPSLLATLLAGILLGSTVIDSWHPLTLQLGYQFFCIGATNLAISWYEHRWAARSRTR